MNHKSSSDDSGNKMINSVRDKIRAGDGWLQEFRNDQGRNSSSRSSSNLTM